MNTRVSQPASIASSTAYWISGLSTIGNISFGTVLVAGRNRVPSPATGNTAMRTRGVAFGVCMRGLLLLAGTSRREGDDGGFAGGVRIAGGVELGHCGTQRHRQAVEVVACGCLAERLQRRLDALDAHAARQRLQDLRVDRRAI